MLYDAHLSNVGLLQAQILRQRHSARGEQHLIGGRTCVYILYRGGGEQPIDPCLVLDVRLFLDVLHDTPTYLIEGTELALVGLHSQRSIGILHHPGR